MIGLIIGGFSVLEMLVWKLDWIEGYVGYGVGCGNDKRMIKEMEVWKIVEVG